MSTLLTEHAPNPLVEAVNQFETLVTRRERLRANQAAERERQEKLKREQAELADIEQTLRRIEAERSGMMTLQDFAAKQACQHPPILIPGAGYTFENGARHDGGFSSGEEPPSDPFQLARVRRIFYQALLEQQIETFARYREKLTEQLSICEQCKENVPLPPADAADKLKVLKEKVDATKAELAAIAKVLEDSPEAKEALARQRQADEHAQELERRRRAITSIEL